MAWQGFIDLIWMIVLLFMLGYFLKYRAQFKWLQTWPWVDGHISEFSWIKRNHFLWADIQYTYQVDGVSYSNNRLFVEQRFRSPKSAYARRIAYQIAVAYEKGEAITVFYNPDSPGQSVLDTRVPLKLTVILLFLSVFLVIHLASVLFRYFG
ncbi:hypothetical protein Lbir_0975 [Legionella birminghamensis]|uniref:Protein of uncharacterized function (DUF3592) n=1 Tax=Legionella birminghamensis TaxID=28083 RepID=A0A378I5G6_9GAMM|nr:DUF3592 domain-containing protein [Legionella birminghamensis]KTC73919.1 hypothetical protein Lbir_0975 [Legionella birminghamensis]STX30437.1 Protein of uncharacterised function (DUF3592) [Legionella birminghamensis]